MHFCGWTGKALILIFSRVKKAKLAISWISIFYAGISADRVEVVTIGGVGTFIFCTPPKRGHDSFLEKQKMTSVILPR